MRSRLIICTAATRRCSIAMRACTKRLPLLRGVVFGVLAQIAELAGAPDLLRQLGVELAFEQGDLVLQPLENLLFHASAKRAETVFRRRAADEKPSRPICRLGRETTSDSSISAMLNRPCCQAIAPCRPSRRPPHQPPEPARRALPGRRATRRAAGARLVEGATLRGRGLARRLGDRGRGVHRAGARRRDGRAARSTRSPPPSSASSWPSA